MYDRDIFYHTTTVDRWEEIRKRRRILAPKDIFPSFEAYLDYFTKKWMTKKSYGAGDDPSIMEHKARQWFDWVALAREPFWAFDNSFIEAHGDIVVLVLNLRRYRSFIEQATIEEYCLRRDALGIPISCVVDINP